MVNTKLMYSIISIAQCLSFLTCLTAVQIRCSHAGHGQCQYIFIVTIKYLYISSKGIVSEFRRIPTLSVSLCNMFKICWNLNLNVAKLSGSFSPNRRCVKSNLVSANCSSYDSTIHSESIHRSAAARDFDTQNGASPCSRHP